MRPNWLFCWTELGAQQVGQIQSLLTTCALHDVDPYTYLVDVLQRIDCHPQSQVQQLTSRLWKQHFADAPLRSLLHREAQPTAIEGVLELLSENGLGAMAKAMETLLNEAMKLERSEFLRAAPGERTDERTGYTNGFKDKTMRTRVGELALRVPQARPLPGGEPLGFYPKSLERGLRSERALKLAIAEMYVQGVSTRRLTEITREPCGLDRDQHRRLARGCGARCAAHDLARATARALLVPDPRCALREGSPQQQRIAWRRHAGSTRNPRMSSCSSAPTGLCHLQGTLRLIGKRSSGGNRGGAE